DGAGPVIWTVVKEIKALGDRKQDIVTITLSEPIQSPNGSAFAVGSQPMLVLYVWTKDSSGAYVLDSIMLSKNAVTGDAINTFEPSSDGKTITFIMSNGKDLTSRDFISIQPNSIYIADKSNMLNIPSNNNQKVMVTVLQSIPNVIAVGPNPCKPTLDFPPGQDPKKIILADEPNAINWVKTGGTILQFKISISSDPLQKITGYLRIYDLVGNLVNKAETNNSHPIIKPAWSGVSTVRDIDIYWNGINSKGMMVAPGGYQALLVLTFQDSKGSQPRKYFGVIGIKRGAVNNQ
ncbi:MAG TPA: hypothetical protein VF335_03345, partial [Chitinivibrionales bacterium]